MTLHVTCPTNRTEIDLGFWVAAEGEPQPRLTRGEARGTRLPSGEIRVQVSECPACGRLHYFVAPPSR
jgi:hypothetical protein